MLKYNGRDLELHEKVTAAILEMAATLPGRRRWVDRVLRFEASRANVEHVLRRIEGLVIDESAYDVIARLEAHRRKSDVLFQAKSAPVTDIIDYQFKTRPYAHQAKAFLLSRDAQKFALFMDMGTGKSKVIIDTACWLYGQGRINAVVVIAPNGVHSNWVERELPVHMPDGVPLEAAVWRSSDESKSAKAKLEALLQPREALKIISVNVEAFASEKVVKYLTRFIQGRQTLVVIDESTRIKTPGAARTKAILKLFKRAPYKRILTGTPVTEGVENLFSQLLFLGEDILGFSSFYTFRNRYCEMGGFQQKEIVGYRNLPELVSLVEPFSFHVRKEDCLDLPAKVYETREVDLTPEQRKAYDDLKKRLVAELGGATLSVPQAMTKVMRLQQIACGWFPTDEGDIIPLPCNRLKVLKDVLEDVRGKAIIWCRFRADIEAVLKLLGKDAVAYFGDVSSEDRTRAIEEFQNGKVPYFVGNPKSGGIGLTLTAATTVIYYSNSFSLEERLQSEDRAHRIGQTKTVTYIDLLARNTVDEKIVKALQEKKDVAELVMQAL